MLTDGDGRPMPPIGSKVRFFLFCPGCPIFALEGVITNYNPDQPLKFFTLAAGCRYYNYLECGENWVTTNEPFPCPSVKLVHGLVVVEPSIGVTNDDIKTREGSDFSHFFDSEFLTDLQLKCEDETFHVHKVILAAASPYFEAMFQHDMTEARSGSIELREVKPNVIKTVLEWIYKNKLDVKDFKDDPDRAGDLLASAEMYQLDELKKIVEDELCDSLQLENVLELVVMGDMHGASKLKEKALKLIAEKKKDVEKLDDWKKFLKSYPDLTFEIIKML